MTPTHNTTRSATTTLLLLLTLAATLTACVPEHSDPGPSVGTEDPDNFGKAGTGSAGGNPLTLAFDSEDSTAQPALHWAQPFFHIGSLSIVDPDPTTGLCNPQNTTPSRSISIQNTFTTDDINDLLAVPAPKPCSITILPARNIPLLSIHGDISSPIFDLSIPLDLSYTLPQGIVLQISQNPNLPQSHKAFLITNLDQLIHNIDLNDLLRDLSSLDLSDDDNSDIAHILRNNLAPALHVYLDPTPGDGTIYPHERTEAHRFATLSIPTQTPSDSPLKEDKNDD